FWFDYRHQIPFLTKRGIACQCLRVRGDACARRNFLADGDDGPPFGKTRSQFSVFCEPLAQSVKTLGDLLAWEIRHGLGALVHFNPSNDPLLLQRFYEGVTVASFLPNRLVEENHTADKFACASGGKQKFAICPPVLFR